MDNSAPLLKDLSEDTMTEAKAALNYSVLFWKTSRRLFPCFGLVSFMAKVIVRIFGTLLYETCKTCKPNLAFLLLYYTSAE